MIKDNLSNNITKDIVINHVDEIINKIEKIKEQNITNKHINENTVFGLGNNTGILVNINNHNGIYRVKIGDYLIIEQNKYKDSIYGRVAREGKKVYWIIDESKKWDNGYRLFGKYIGRWVDGKYENLIK